MDNSYLRRAQAVHADPSPERRHRIERRADEILDGFDGQPIAVDDDRDLVVFLDDCSAPFIIPPENIDLTLRVIGGQAFATEIAALERRPGHALTVIMIDGFVQVVWIRLRRLSQGGVA